MIKNCKLFLTIFILVLICTGCSLKNKKSFINVKKDPYKITKYKDGTILIQDNTSSDSEKNNDDFTPKPATTDINFGPAEIKFGN
ncbi:MAG: hypothetical protein KAQ92_09050 [Candidatus Aenigmarchaeota archaeon]|nr:hypothetical protein [Candidatus Aenigmarchaeota archaeon]